MTASLRRSLSASLASATTEQQTRFWQSLTPAEAQALYYAWDVWARDDQLPPQADTDWTTWLLLGGRGAGKTRAGAEWVRTQVHEPIRIALVGETLADVRDVMVEGPSGLLAVSPPDERPKWIGSKRRVEWPSGTVALAFSSEDPEALRGHQAHIAWSDEFAKWRHMILNRQAVAAAHMRARNQPHPVFGDGTLEKAYQEFVPEGLVQVGMLSRPHLRALAEITAVFSGERRDASGGAVRCHRCDEMPDWSSGQEPGTAIGDVVFLRTG